jgi:hypothetical protein
MRDRSYAGSYLAFAALAMCAFAGGAAFAETIDTAAPNNPKTTTYATSWDEFQALKEKAHGGTKMSSSALPDWTGLWTRENGAGLKFDASQKSMAETTAAPSPAYQVKLTKKIADFKKGVEWDQLSFCLPAGYPRWLAEPFLKEFVLRPEESWLINEQLEEIRRVYTDGRPHIPDDEAYPLWEGDSIGFWNGDTLVVHTNNLKKGQYQRQQPDYSEKTTTVEQWHKIGPNMIEDVVDVYDPEGLAKPWHVVQRYQRVTTPNLRIAYWSCEENNNVTRGADGNTQFLLPGDKGYKDPNTLQDSLSGGKVPDAKK